MFQKFAGCLFVFSMVLSQGCTSSASPPATPVKDSTATPCEKSPGSCDNYDRASLILADMMRSTVQTGKEGVSAGYDAAKEAYNKK